MERSRLAATLNSAGAHPELFRLKSFDLSRLTVLDDGPCLFATKDPWRQA